MISEANTMLTSKVAVNEPVTMPIAAAIGRMFTIGTV
jgi:hypothetical protein